MKKVSLLLLFTAIFVFVAISQTQVKHYVISQITNNSGIEDAHVDLNDDLSLVWQRWDGTDWEIMLYKGRTLKQLSSNYLNDLAPDINNNGKAVWYCPPDIYLYDGAKTINFTNSLSIMDWYPRINDLDQIVWMRAEGNNAEIVLWNGTAIVPITDNASYDMMPVINNLGHVAWMGKDPDGSDIEIFFYNGAETINISDNDVDDWYPSINDFDQVVWTAPTGEGVNSYEIFMCTGAGIPAQITDNEFWDNWPVINNNGFITWSSNSNGRYQIFLYDGTTTIQLTDNLADHMRPVLNGNNYIAWFQYPFPAEDAEIFLAIPAGKPFLPGPPEEPGPPFPIPIPPKK